MKPLASLVLMVAISMLAPAGFLMMAQPPPAGTIAVSVPKGKTLRFTVGDRIPAGGSQLSVLNEMRPVPGVRATAADGKLTVSAAATAQPGKYILAMSSPVGPVPLPIEVRVVAERGESDAIVEEMKREATAQTSANQAAFGEGWDTAGFPAPNPAIVNLQASGGRALVQQINSNSFAGPALGRLQQLAAMASDPAVRTAALDALRRSPDARGRALLPAAHRSAQTDAEKLRSLDRQLLSGKFKFAIAKPAGLLQTKIDLSKILLPPPPVVPPDRTGEWWALRVTGPGIAAVSPSELTNPGRNRQIFIVPAGYQVSEFDKFKDDVNRTIFKMGTVDGSTLATFSSKYRDQIHYIVQWHPGAALDMTGKAVFDAKLFPHPTRGGKAIALNQNKLFQAVDAFKASKLITFAPIAVLVIFNSDDDVTANASPPTFLIPDQQSRAVKNYGIARITRYDINTKVPMHEVAHAAFNWLDEYHESGLTNTHIAILDVLSPLVQLDSSWPGGLSTLSRFFGTYDFRISECMADNGADNISTRRQANTVGFPFQNYGFEGGMFFGKGVYREAQHTVMEDYSANHPPSHQQVLKQAFEGAAAGRANDRIRNAGPITDWAFGSSVQLMLHDADKHHRWHPTQQYEVEVGWYEKEWKTCVVPNSAFTYPCWLDTWKSFTKKVTPQLRLVDLGKLLSNPTIAIVLYHLGMDNISAALPTLKWPVPYQEIDITVPNLFQTYYWRFRTYNGARWSEWTGHSNFRRVL